MGNAFLYGNGSGTELAIKIVGGTQRPETGKQGTIWINTNQSITGWTIQSEEPISPAEGMIWINNMTSAKLNALKKNGIWFMPTSAKQYTNGAWTKKTGEYYNNNQWVAFSEATINIIYLAGSTCTATDGITTLVAPDKSGIWKCTIPAIGTWTIVNEERSRTVVVKVIGEEISVDITKEWLITSGRYNPDITYLTRSSATIIDNYLKINQTRNEHCFMHMYPISLTGYNTIHVKIADNAPTMSYHEGDGYCGCGFGVSDTKKTPSNPGDNPTTMWIANTRFPKSTYPGGTFVLDVSILKGDYYFGFDFEGRSTGAEHLRIENAWLEA